MVKQILIENRGGARTHTLDSNNIVIYHPNYKGSAETLLENDI